MQIPGNNIAHLSLAELRKKWAECWGMQPPAGVGRVTLEKSLAYKMRERAGEGLTPAQQKRLDHLVAQYRRNPQCFDQKQMVMKPGTRLVRVWKGKRCNVMVRAEGFEYKEKIYTSLSQIAYDITGTRWNGWVFFGLKEKARS